MLTVFTNRSRCAKVSESINSIQRDLGGVVFGQGQRLVAIGNLGSSSHQVAVLDSMVVLLRTQSDAESSLPNSTEQSVALQRLAQ